MRRNQFKKWGGYSSLLWAALIVPLSACAATPMDANTVPLDRADKVPMQLTIKGEDINTLLATEGNLINGIDGFAQHAGNHNKNIRKLIAQMRASNQNSAKKAPGFTGINGALAHEVLTIIEEEALLPSGMYDGRKKVVVSMEGKVIDYGFKGSVGIPGDGKLTVIAAVTYKVIPSQGGSTPKTDGYKWEIKVNNNGFEVHNNCQTSGACGPNDQPFPGTMEFSQTMINRVQTLGFQHKLWAKGTDIEVVNVWRKKNFQWTDAGDSSYWGGRLPDASAIWGRLYKIDQDSCIDMMFVDPPPKKYTDLQGPPFYCLGRCEQPAIVNSR